MFRLYSHHQAFITITCEACMLNTCAMWDPIYLMLILRPAHKCYENYSVTPPYLAVLYKATSYMLV
jgi:hypothetical protein